MNKRSRSARSAALTISKHWVAMAFAFVALATGAMAGGGVSHPVLPQPTSSAPDLHPPVATMKPLPSLKPIAVPTIDARKRYIHAVPGGTRVPFSRLPRLPMKTAFNTIVPGPHKHGVGHYRPMNATGASITVTSSATCTTDGTVGDLFNVGCELTIQATNLSSWSSGDGYEYFVVAPNATSATAFTMTTCTPADAAPWTAAESPSCTNANTTLSEQGTYMFFVYDTSAQVIAAAVFVNAGQVFNIAVYQDAFHTQQAYQFDTASSTAAYIYLQNVAPSDSYVVYAYADAVNNYCAFLAPTGTQTVPTARPTGTTSQLLCNPSTSNVTGVQAPGGNLSITWTLSSGLEAGAYTIVVFDQSANSGAGEALGSVQISLTSGGSAIFTEGCTISNCAASPNPSAGPNGPSTSSILAWDSTTDQSVSGVEGTLEETITGSSTGFRWSISNPMGEVIGTSAPEVVATPTGTPSPGIFVFSKLPITPAQPGYDPSSVYVMQLYNIAAEKVESSQEFQLVGYHATTQWVQDGTIESDLNFTGTGGGVYTEYAALKITNDSNTVFNSQGDSFGQGTNLAVLFTTANDLSLQAAADYQPPNSANSNTYCGTAGERTCGTLFLLPGTCTGSYNSAGGCSVTVQDSNGNNWTATEWCTTTPSGTNAPTNGWCVLGLSPTSSSTVLAPGAYIQIGSSTGTTSATTMTWYAEGDSGGWNCYDSPCTASTTVLPSHGLSWSTIANYTSPTAWTPVSIGSNVNNTNLDWSARFDYVAASPTPSADFKTQGATPWTEAHYYQAYFTRAAYQRSTPFASSNANVAAFYLDPSTGADNIENVDGTNGDAAVAISIPSYISASSVCVDEASSGKTTCLGTGGTWEIVTCPSTFGSTYVCLAHNGGEFNTAQTIYLDLPLPVSSFAFQLMSVQAFSKSELLWFTLTNNGTSENTIDQCSDCGEPSGGVTSLGIGAYSLNSALMSSVFTPSTVGSGISPLTFDIVVQNATTAADPNPDAIDAVVIEEQGSSPEGTAAYAVDGTPTFTREDGTTWSYLGTIGPTGTSPSNTIDYWFGVGNACGGNWDTLAGGPPQPAGKTTPLTAQYSALVTCGTTAEAKSLWNDSSHSEATIVLPLKGPFTAGTHTFYMYAHGANGGGWSSPKSFTVNVTSESASAGFYSLGTTCPGTAVATNALPTISGTANCYVYTIKNTSSSASIGTVNITIPAYDISGGSANAWTLTGSPITTNIEVGTISGGAFTQGSGNKEFGCSVNTSDTATPDPGIANGTIQVSGCTSFTSGQTLAVEFQAGSPSVEGDTYQFPSVLDPSPGPSPGGANVSTGAAWLGDQDVQTQGTIGLSVVVAPLSNPGPGYSTPSQNCTQCAFSGTTIDFGTISAGGSVTATDVARATVIYAGSCTSSCSTWELEVNGSGTATALSELYTSVDETNGSTAANDPTTGGGAPITYQSGVGTFFTMPSSPTELATGLEETLKNECYEGSNYCYDTIQNYKVSPGADTSGHFVTVVYTLIAN